MTMRLSILLCVLAAAGSPAFAATRLLSGPSIDFNTPALWGKAVSFGLDDQGGTTGGTRWYSALSESGATIRKHDGSSLVSGYLETIGLGDVHRTIPVLSAGESGTGPAENKGEPVPVSGLYIDTVVSLAAHDSLTLPRVGDGRDKLNCWVYRSADGATTNFVITAGAYEAVTDAESGVTTYALTATNYVTDAAPAADGSFRLTVRALPSPFADYPDLMGFEVSVDGVRVSCGGRTVFPSLVAPDPLNPGAGVPSKLYSCGFSGQTRAEMVNFTKVDPIADPTYDKEDLSMLRETALITVSGYPVAAQALYDFPMLVRVSETKIPGFRYERALANGGDLRFTDANGTLLPCEVERWDVTGESLVWVKVPLFCNGITVRMHWSPRAGATLPGNSPRKVWSDYLAVWHLGDAVSGNAKDATGNGHTATVASGVTTVDGVMGKAASLSGGSLIARDPRAVGDLTFTGWYRANGDLGTERRKLFGTQDGVFGWGGFEEAHSNLLLSAEAGASVSLKVTDLREQWLHAGLTISGSRLTAYVNGQFQGSSSGTNDINTVGADMLVAAGGMIGDEVRLTHKVRSADWIRAEFAQASEPAFFTVGSATAKGTENYWIVEPSLSASSAPADEASSIRVDAGRARYGAAIVEYRRIDGRSYGTSMPSEAGAYQAVFTVNPATDGSRDGLVKEITFVLYDKRSYRAIGGYDRVMLFNSDATPQCPVSGQGYYDVDADTNAVWVSEGAAWTDTGRRYVVDGTRHVYFAPDTRQRHKLWEFRHARLGNLFESPSGLPKDRHFLPWGGQARRFDDSEMPANSQRYAGVLILQNVAEDALATDPAAAYTQVYTNGIGTVYFDAVNADNLSGSARNKLKVQVCFDSSDYLAPDADLTRGTWRDVPLDVFSITNGVYAEQVRTDEANLAVYSTAGTVDSFYRIRAVINTNVAARIRIVRTETLAANGEDGKGLVMVDNIVVSPPAMGVVLSNFGAPAEPGNTVLRGQRAPFDIAFPSAADLGSLHAAVRIGYLLSGTNTIDSSFVGVLAFKYRWRYLDQRIGAWTDLTLVADPADPTRYVSLEPITGEGEGDIEYAAQAMVNAPYYEYWDYTGGGWTWPDGYSERRGDVHLSGDRAVSPGGIYDDAHPSPALGKDFFIRLREGRSDYEGVRLHVRRVMASGLVREDVVPMEVFGDRVWRGYYQMITNGAETLAYRIEAYNRQTAGAGDYQWNTNWLYGVTQTSIPANDVLESGDGSQWTTVACDELTEYLLFQFEDTTRSLTVIHADYQDFNAWSDANRPDGDEKGHFVGSSVSVPTSGVSRLSKSLTDGFGYLTATVATNSDWQESFPAGSGGVSPTNARWAINRPFSSALTPKGWTAANGMWVSEQFDVVGGSSFAFQMNGEGYGSLAMSQQFLPRGLERFSYAARVAESYGQHPFNYYVGTTNDVYNLKNYTFSVPCAMRRDSSDADFSGKGAVSAVANYRDSVGGYEVRAERIGVDEVRLSLYKWGPDGTAKLMATSGRTYAYGGSAGCGFDAYYNCFAGLYISCSNTENSVRIAAGLLSAGQRLSGAISMSGKSYFSLFCEDTAADRHVSGTCGVGSIGCPSTFALPRFSDACVAWPQDVGRSTSWPSCEPGEAAGVSAWYAKTAQTVTFEGERELMGLDPADLKLWNAYAERLPGMMFTNVSGQVFCAFRAKAPRQEVILETSLHNSGLWSPVSTNVVSSYGFVRYDHIVRVADDLDIRIRTGSDKGGPAVVVDDLTAVQWRGENYDEEGHRYEGVYYDILGGAPTNFVFTTAWIGEDGAIELSPMRSSTVNPNSPYPVSVRSPLMDGNSGRGLGLGSFGFAYHDADAHARLIVQICTNGVNSANLVDRTVAYETWTDVASYDFSTMTPAERQSGVITCYVGLHGVVGVMRVVVDPTLVTEAHNPAANPANDPAYGRVYVSMANAKDSPSLDDGSWWGWNLRTTDDPTMWLLKDGSASDAGTYGLSFALNNSITDDVRSDDSYDDNMPFLQTPMLARSAIGELSFKARKYSSVDAAPAVAIYGLREGGTNFEFITSLVVDTDVFRRYTYQASMSSNYRAFRLAVTGVPGVKESGPLPESGSVERVLIDEVSVSETVEARMGFRNVGAFRSQINDNDWVPNVPSRSEQPLCRESWGVQAEVYALRLADRIDTSREPEVYLHWIEGASPWGYENWRNSAKAYSAKLSKADGTNMIYRSSYLKSPDAVITTDSTEAGTIVQYSLEVVYYMVGQSAALTNVLTSSDWQNPAWYRPVDYNASFGDGGKSFSAYCILDTVAPGWAWINECNLFGTLDEIEWENSDKANQYIEIAAPVEADLTGWMIRLLQPDVAASAVHTNVLAVFGDELPGTKKKNEDSKMVFHVVANASTKSAGKLKPADGTLDGVWSIQSPTSEVGADGTIEYYNGFGIQLVRSSGVVEHEVVGIGTNVFAGVPNFEELFSPTNAVNALNRLMADAQFFYAGSDDGGQGNSLGVVSSHGETSNHWVNVMGETPGRINKGQTIDPDHPTPLGSSITVYSELKGGHLRQTVGKAVLSDENQVFFIRKGSYAGTNITYTVDEWFEMADVSVTEGGPVWTYSPNTRELTVTVGKGCSNNTLTVTARAQVDKRLRDLGCDENNKYTPAIVNWLSNRTFLDDSAYGFRDWPDSDGRIYLADLADLTGTVVTNLSLTEMYWLDVCPTISNQCLVAGICSPPTTIYPRPGGDQSITNIGMTVKMMFTNRDESVSSPYRGRAWAPYVVQALEPGVNSWSYESTSRWAWTNATFKIVGLLAVYDDWKQYVESNWVPERFFVFHKGSFDAAFKTYIEVPEGYSPRSIGYMSGWGEWFRKHPGRRPPIYYKWNLNTRLMPVDVEVLTPSNPLQY